MSRTKLGFFSALFMAFGVLGAITIGSLLWPADAQEPAKPNRLKELLQQRAITTRDWERQAILKFKNANANVEEILEPTRLAHEAALDLCDTDKERINVLEDYLAAAKNNERIATAFVKSGQLPETVALKTRAERLRVEIALERVKNKKAGGGQKAEPKKADNKNVTVQPGVVEAFETVHVFPRIAGILKTQSVDIGSKVKSGQILAVLDVPELEKQIQIDAAANHQARARVLQAKARVAGSEADVDSARAAILQSEANLKRATAFLRYRKLNVQRMKELFTSKSIEERILDEASEQYEAALEAENAAKAKVASARAEVAAALTKVEQARADLMATEAGVKLASATLDKSQAQLAMATFTAPFDGVITSRSFYPGDFIRTNDKAPLLTIQRIDRVRVVVGIPDQDASHINVGNKAEIEFDALPGKKIASKVARMADIFDPQTRLMRVEIDLPNPNGEVRPGMYGRVSILRDK